MTEPLPDRLTTDDARADWCSAKLDEVKRRRLAIKGGAGRKTGVPRLRAWRARRSPWMQQVHHAGHKLFVDFSGKRPRLVDATTGMARDVELFVGVLGASNLSYAEAVSTRRTEDWIGAHVRMLEFFGGVPQQLVPDQLRSAVSVPSRYEPTIQRTYADLARHYDTAVVPARSVQCQYLRERVELRVTANTVEVFHRGTRVASHVRDDTPNVHTTVADHMPRITAPGSNPTRARSSRGHAQSARAQKPSCAGYSMSPIPFRRRAGALHAA